MAIGNLVGRARPSLRHPGAMGECDRCRFWYQLDDLHEQWEWRGAALADTGFLVCKPCLDVPQEQFRVLILPTDPQPRVPSRPSPDITQWATYNTPVIPTNPENLGFSQYVLGSPAYIEDYPNPLTGGSPITGKEAVLARVAFLSRIPTPNPFDLSIVIQRANIGQVLLGAQPMRSWVLFYNPTQVPMQIAFGNTAMWGVTTNVSLGPGEAYFWSTSQGLGNVYTGPISVISQTAGAAVWAWEQPAGLVWVDGYGVPIVDGYGNYIPWQSPFVPTGYWTDGAGNPIVDGAGNLIPYQAPG